MKDQSKANRGKSLEKTLEDRAQWYKDVFVIRLGPPGHVSRIAGKVVWIMTGVLPPDYLAIKAGHAILADAKSTGADRWAYSNLERHQAEALDKAARCGATTGLIVQLRAPDGPIWWVPWAAIRDLWWMWYNSKERAKAGSASLSAEWLALVGRKVVGGDWVGVAK